MRRYMERGRRVVLAVLLVLAVVAIDACSKSSPTEPDRRLHLAVVAGLENAEAGYKNTIKRMQLLVDGTVVRDYSASPPVHDVLMTGTVDVDTGQHKIEVRIVSQTVSPSTYKASGSVEAFDDSGKTVKSITFPDRTQAMNTNDGVVYSFQL